MGKIRVEVAYALPEEQVILEVELREGATVAEAIRESGVLGKFPGIDLGVQKVGVFSEVRELSDRVFEGERVEIYRGLLVDPKEGRRKRVKGSR